jgi:predicted Ser/Thr protein kinase
MLNIKSQMAELEEKMANLPNEAKKNFRGDVPQYIVDAFVSNNAQRYQSELNKLQSRYN